MDHTQATEGHVAERYLLGELPADEAEAFERHYFECTECAEAVEGGGEFIANARAVLAEDGREARHAPAPPQRVRRESKQSWWFWPRWVPVAAAVALAAVALYQGVIVIPGIRQALTSPQALPAFQLAGLSRGSDATVSVPAGTPWLALSVDIPPDVHFPQYASIVTSHDRTVFRVDAGAPRDGEPISILVPARNLDPGDYEFTVYGVTSDGQQRDKVATSRFKFQIH